MKEFLTNLYKQSESDRTNYGIDSLFRVIPLLAHEKKFEAMDSMLQEVDLSSLDTSIMYCMIHMVAAYVKFLPTYKSFYQKVREEFARRGEPSDRICKLFDKYETGDSDDRLYDPDRPKYKSPEEKNDELLEAKISWAKEIGDKDLVDILTFYQSSRLHSEEKDRKYRELQRTLGRDILRERTVKALRKMADLLDKSASSWPDIYYCDLPEEPIADPLMNSITVITSYPWPG